MNHMIHYDWPGNVRELVCGVERGVVLIKEDIRLDVFDKTGFSIGVTIDDRRDAIWAMKAY